MRPRPIASLVLASMAIVATLMCVELDVQHTTLLSSGSRVHNSAAAFTGETAGDLTPESVFVADEPPSASDDSESDGEGEPDVYPGGRQDMQGARSIVTGVHEETSEVRPDDFDPMPPLLLPPPPPPPPQSMPNVPNTTAPTPAPTNVTVVPVVPFTMAPTATPTATPTAPPTVPSCAACISGFVQNHGCEMWHAGLDAKSAVAPGCDAPNSPLLSDAACEKKMASVCGMTKRPADWGPPPPPLVPCNDEQKAALHSSVAGHLGCMEMGGKCMVNAEVPQCVCKPGWSGRACDVGPGANKNASVSSEFLVAADLLHSTDCANSNANHKIIKSATTEELTADGETRPVTLTYGKMKHSDDSVGAYLTISVDESTTAWLEQFQFVQAVIADQKFRVHLGFWRAVGPLLDELGDKVKDVVSDNKELAVAGYGQGGAMANIVALYMSLKQGYNVSLITLAAPRVGDFNFAQAVTSHLKQVDRVVRSGDPYIVVPTQSCKDYFRCLGGELPYVYYVHAGAQTTLPASGANPELCMHPTFHHEGVNGGIGHLHKLKVGPHGSTCLAKHDLKQYVKDLAVQVEAQAQFVCTQGSFKFLPPPPSPPPVHITNVPLQQPPSLKDWGIDPKGLQEKGTTGVVGAASPRR